jgi:phospholipid transport system transporter-binding protein
MAAVTLPAVLTISEARVTLAQLQQAIAADATPVLDATGVQTVDTSAIAVLLDCQRTAAAAGKRLQVVGLPAKLTQLAKLYGVDALIAQ